MSSEQLYHSCTTRHDDGTRIPLKEDQKWYYPTSDPYWKNVIVTRNKAKNKKVIHGSPMKNKDEKR